MYCLIFSGKILLWAERSKTAAVHREALGCTQLNMFLWLVDIAQLKLKNKKNWKTFVCTLSLMPVNISHQLYEFQWHTPVTTTVLLSFTYKLKQFYLCIGRLRFVLTTSSSDNSRPWMLLFSRTVNWCFFPLIWLKR